MEKELETSQEELTEDIDSTTDEEVSETTEESEEETEETTEEDDDNIPTVEDYKNLKQKNKELYERAKKAEAIAKVAKSKPPKKETNTEQVNQSEIIELSRLAARGYSDEDIELLKDIKALKGLDKLSEAIDSPIFSANKLQREKEAEKEKAQLGSSKKGSTFKANEKTTPEDLKKAWLNK